MQVKHLPEIVIKSVPHHKQRYDTCGDYYHKNGQLHINVSKMNDNHEFLVAMHELIEWYLCYKQGITIEAIDKFDMEFENRRKNGNTDEPGNDPKAPYFREHNFATYIEEQIATELGVDWEKYDKHVNSL